MVPLLHKRSVRYSLITLWVLVVASALYFYFFQRALVQAHMESAFSTSLVVGSVVYVLLGAVRAFTLVPATFVLVVALPFFPPLLLALITLPAIAIASSICYFFAEALQMDELLERKYPAHVARLKDVLQRHQLPIIIGWSFVMILPTDVLCYVCGSLRINFPKFLVGVLIGEGAVYALYIYLADYLLR